MSIKYAALIAGIMAALGYGVGRYLQPPEVHTVVQIKKEIEIQQKIHTVTKIVEHNDGTKETIIDQNDERNTQSDTSRNQDITVSTGKKSNFSILAGIQPQFIGGISPGAVNLGAHWQTQPVSFLPVTLGLWGLAIPTPTVGVSLGWSY